LGVTPPTIYNAFNLLEAPEEVKQAGVLNYHNKVYIRGFLYD